MPRQDVPYGGAICRLKERIAEIWNKLGEKLHSINGVEGDAAGNVEIVSGDAAITISDDQVNHQITIGLDQTELPSAAVTRVNRKTGDVVLNAQDIYDTDNHATVQSMINGLLFDETNLKGSINSEAQARQAADNVLQGNINSVQASIPGAAATAVANDPTVAQLATDVPNKVDKITSGSTLKAYTHTGATQGETSVVDGTAANSIGIRDANGRMQAADPASGATDKTLVTANWVSQTGAGAPNNLLHTNGDETANGLKTFTNQIRRISPDWSYLELRATRADKHTIPSSNIRMGGISFQDANGEAIVSLAVDLLTDGHINVILEGMDSNENYWNSVILNKQVIY